MRRHHEGSRSEETISKRRVDVIVALSVGGNQEGQGAVRRQYIHAAVLLAVPGHQGNAALLHVQVRSYGVQGLREWRGGGPVTEIIRLLCVYGCAQNVDAEIKKM